LRAEATAQVGRARKTLSSFQGQASRVLQGLASESRARGAHWAERLQQLTSTRPPDLRQWQARLMKAAGVASRGQVQRINRECTRLAKKVDALSSEKSR